MKRPDFSAGVLDRAHNAKPPVETTIRDRRSVHSSHLRVAAVRDTPYRSASAPSSSKVGLALGSICPRRSWSGIRSAAANVGLLLHVLARPAADILLLAVAGSRRRSMAGRSPPM